jgi:hypothetical protein
MAILDIPYVSQLEDGARKYSNDCSAASGVMLIRAYNNDQVFTVDDYYEETGQREDVFTGIESPEECRKELDPLPNWGCRSACIFQ